MNISIPNKIAIPKIEEIVYSILIVFVSGTGVAGIYPIGVALAGTFMEKNPILYTVAVLLGAVGVGRGQVAKSLLILFVYILIMKLRNFKRIELKAITIGLASLIASMFAMIWDGFSVLTLLSAIPEAFLAGYLFVLFSHLGKKGILTYFAEIILAGTALTRIYGVQIPYIETDFAFLIASLTVMGICYSCDVLTATLSGLLLGFLLHLGMQNAFEMAGIFAISAMSAALLSKTGKIGTATGYLTAMTIAVLYMGSLKDMGIGDIFAAPLLFAVLPEKTHIKIGSHINEIMNEEISKDSKKIAVKLKTVAKAVCDLGDGVKIISGNSPSYKEEMLFAGIMSRMCDDCKFGKMCFGKEAKYLAMEEMKRALEQDGFLNEENIPQKFKGICIRWAQFSEEFCHMYEMYKQDTVHIGETVNDRDIIAKQYGELSKMIAVLSDGLCRDRQEYDEDELTFSVRVAVCQESKDNGAENGDTVTHFRKNDKYYVILCDGMGVGSTAKEESSLTAHLFEEFIKAGIEKQSVISIINSTLALKVDRESFSSVDLLEIDLIKGDATFLKIGSAQSYVKSGNNIETITSTALPIGILENIEVKEQQIKLKRNDIVLMVSDGVDEAKSGVKKNEWIKKILTETEENDFETAHKIIVGAKSRAQEGDDVTSIVIRIMKGCG